MPNSSSCIDLIFMDQSNLIVDSGAYPSLHSADHHQVTYCRCNLTVEFPPPMKDLSGIIKEGHRINQITTYFLIKMFINKSKY